MAKKRDNGLILPAKFIAELEAILDMGPHRCRIEPRKIKWLDELLGNYGLGSLSPEELGQAYEQLYADTSHRKKSGIFYTPPEVVRMIVDETVGGWCDANPGSMPRLLEPACGAGAFATAVFEKLWGINKENSTANKLIRQICDAIHLNDIDPSALSIAALCMARKINGIAGPLKEEIRINVSSNDFLDVPRWIGENQDRPQYDVIIGNPPYISYYAKGSQGITETLRHEWARHFISARGRVNTFLLFIEMALKLLAPCGRIGFVIPNTFLIMKSYEKLRRYVLDTCHLRFIADLSLGIFAGAEVPCCVVVMEKRDPGELRLDHPVKVCSHTDDNKRRDIELDSGRFRRLPYVMFNVGLDKTTCEIIDRMESGAEQLKAFVDVRDGINPANIKSKIISPTKAGPNYKPVLQGRDVKPYCIDWSGMFVNYNPEAVDESKGEYCFFREERIFLAKKKLVNRQTARRLIAALDENCFYALNSCHLTLVEDDRLDILYLLALYNSDLLNFYYTTVFRDTEKVFPQVKTANIEKLPLKFGDPELLAEIVTHAATLSERGADSKKQNEITAEIESGLATIYGLSNTQVGYMRKPMIAK